MISFHPHFSINFSRTVSEGTQFFINHENIFFLICEICPIIHYLEKLNKINRI